MYDYCSPASGMPYICAPHSIYVHCKEIWIAFVFHFISQSNHHAHISLRDSSFRRLSVTYRSVAFHNFFKFFSFLFHIRIPFDSFDEIHKTIVFFLYSWYYICAWRHFTEHSLTMIYVDKMVFSKMFNSDLLTDL